jgi:hypothetical protein
VTDPPDPEELLQNRQPEQQNSSGIGNNVMRLALKRNGKSKLLKYQFLNTYWWNGGHHPIIQLVLTLSF